MGEKLASLLKQQHPEGIDVGVDFKDRTQAAFVVPKEDIAAQKYDLSINRYNEVVYQAEEYEDPKVILKRLKDLEKEILADLDELEGCCELADGEYRKRCKSNHGQNTA